MTIAMPTRDYYKSLITSEYRLARRFNAMVQRVASYGCKLDSATLKIVDQFDVDSAVSNQLDILGACVGVSRELSFEPTPEAKRELICPTVQELAADTDEKTSEYHSYKGPRAPQLDETDVVSGIAAKDFNEESQLITDDIYRILIKARIVQNHWKGDMESLYKMWDVLFPDTMKIQIQDLQDMSFNIVLIGDASVLLQELIMHGYIIPKPEGVRINMLSFISTDGLPVFTYDMNDFYYSGYSSHWAKPKE